MNIEKIYKRLPKNPVSALYRSQKLKNATCSHLKGITYTNVLNTNTEEFESHPHCNQCGQLLDITDMKKREEQLDKFNNIKLQ